LSLSPMSGGSLCHEEIDQVPWGWAPGRDEQPVTARGIRSQVSQILYPAEAHSAAEAAGAVARAVARAEEATETGTTPPV